MGVRGGLAGLVVRDAGAAGVGMAGFPEHHGDVVEGVGGGSRAGCGGGFEEQAGVGFWAGDLGWREVFG